VRLWVRSDSQHSSPFRFPDEVVRSLVFYVTAPAKSKQLVMHGYFLKGTTQEEGGSTIYFKCGIGEGKDFITGQDTDYWYNVDLERMIETVKNAKREERREKREERREKREERREKREERREKRLKIDVKLGRRQKLPSY
jgi:hypothetical protein